MADIDTAAIRAVYGAEFADGTVYDLCAEVDALRTRLAEAEADAVESVAMYRRCRDQRDKYRARLAEVEAERDGWRTAAKAWDVPLSYRQWREQTERYQTEIVRLREERDTLKTTWAIYVDSAKELKAERDDYKARLAEVEALCDAPDYVRLGLRSVDVARIRAAARGEGDR